MRPSPETAKGYEPDEGRLFAKELANLNMAPCNRLLPQYNNTIDRRHKVVSAFTVDGDSG